MNISDLDTSPDKAYRNPSLGTHVRLVFRSNVREPVKITLNGEGNIVSEEPHYDTNIPDGWEDAEPLISTAIVHAEDWQDQPEPPIAVP